MEIRRPRFVEFWQRLPGWVSTVFWLLALSIFLFVIEPTTDWIQRHPVLFITGIGGFVWSFFMGGVIYDWRYGNDMIRQSQDRILSDPTEPDEPMVGLWIIMGLLGMVLIAVIAFTFMHIVHLPPGQKSTGVIVLGGLMAGIVAPFLTYPVLGLLGVMRSPEQYAASFQLVLDEARPDAFSTRAELDKIPAALGLSRPKPVEDEEAFTWRAKPVSFFNVFFKCGATYSILGQDGEKQLIVKNQTDKGDNETLTLTRLTPVSFDAEIRIDAQSVWARGVLAFGGRRGLARMASKIEAARLSNMLQTGVEVRELNIHVT